MTQKELEEFALSMTGKPILDDAGRKIGKIIDANWNSSNGIIHKIMFDKNRPSVAIRSLE
jgi:sporulation protein YlmC with PRC-barrel domain